MLTGTTKTGFKFAIDESATDDMELLDALVEADAGNPLAFSQVMNRLFAPEMKKNLYDHVRNKDGRVPIKGIVEELTDILSSSGDEIKNC